MIIDKAYDFAQEAHRGQLDDKKRPYFEEHLIPVAGIIQMVTSDEDIAAAALLHDTLEDTNTTYKQLVSRFNKRIADLVLEVTHEGTNDGYGYYFPRLKSRDAIMIKLADRLSNISRMDSWSEARKAHYLRKTRFWNEGG